MAVNQSEAGLVGAMLLLGFLLVSSLPVILEIVEQRAGAAGATATQLIWMTGNAGGIVIALIVQSLTDHPAIAFLVMGATTAAVFPLTRRIGSNRKTSH